VVAIVMDFHLVQNDKMVEDHSTIILVKFVFKWFSNSLEGDLKNVSINQIVNVSYQNCCKKTDMSMILKI
jgi:hypothetical protein